jgi:hypothetical protein
MGRLAAFNIGSIFQGVEMIRVPVKTKDGVYRIMRTRVPRTTTFELYRKAEEEAPELLKQVYAVISRDVEARAKESVKRSAVLIERIPSDWTYRDRWLKFLDSDLERLSFFEQVLWTYFFDREEMWETTWPDKDRKSAEYSRAAAMPPVAQAPSSRGATATVSSKAPSREIAPRSREIAPTRFGPPAASRGVAPVAPPPATTLKPGDTVEIVDHPYAGKTGVFVALVDDDGLKLVTVKMQVGGLFKEVSGFLPSQVRKI